MGKSTIMFTEPTFIPLASTPFGFKSNYSPSEYFFSPALLESSDLPSPRACKKQRKKRRYKLIDDDEKFEIAIDVPGVEKEDIDIKLEEELHERVLTIQGQRKTSSGSSNIASTFSKAVSLDYTVDTDKLTARLKNGVLVISAPKQKKLLEKNVRQIPILDDIKTDDAKSLTVKDKSKGKDEEDKKDGTTMSTQE